MAEEHDNLGVMEAWQIKMFPRNLREDVVRACREEQMPLGEFLTRILLPGRPYKWRKGGAADAPVAADPRRLERAIAMATSVSAAENMPAGVRTLSWQLVKAELKDIKSQTPALAPRPRQAQLSHESAQPAISSENGDPKPVNLGGLALSHASGASQRKRASPVLSQDDDRKPDNFTDAAE